MENEEESFCIRCGTPVIEDTHFCSCGIEITFEQCMDNECGYKPETQENLEITAEEAITAYQKQNGMEDKNVVIKK